MYFAEIADDKLWFKTSHLMLYWFDGKEHHRTCYRNFTDMINYYNVVNKQRVVIYLNEEFTTLRKKYTNAYKDDVHFKVCYADSRKKVPISFRYHNVTFRSAFYYFGSEGFKNEVAAELAYERNLREKAKICHTKSSFTGELGKKLGIDTIKSDYPERSYGHIINRLANQSCRGPILYASGGEDFISAHAYDITSAYPAWMLNALPLNYSRVTCNKSRLNMHDLLTGKYFGKITIKKLTIKSMKFMPLYNNAQMVHDAKTDNSIKVIARQGDNKPGAVMYAENFSYYAYLWLELPILLDAYECEGISISDVYEVTFEDNHPALSQMRETIKTAFDKKQGKKGTAEYASFKVILNRCYGYFITAYDTDDDLVLPRDRKIPYDLGAYTVSAQRHYLWSLINKVGKDNIIAANTDSIVSKIPLDIAGTRIVDNAYKDIGVWKYEGKYDRVYYLTTTSCKYEIDGKLGLKHSGISEYDYQQILRQYTYDTLTKTSTITKTVNKLIKETPYNVEWKLWRKKSSLYQIETAEQHFNTVRK